MLDCNGESSGVTYEVKWAKFESKVRVKMVTYCKNYSSVYLKSKFLYVKTMAKAQTAKKEIAHAMRRKTYVATREEVDAVLRDALNYLEYRWLGWVV